MFSIAALSHYEGRGVQKAFLYLTCGCNSMRSFQVNVRSYWRGGISAPISNILDTLSISSKGPEGSEVKPVAVFPLTHLQQACNVMSAKN
jgi:hypothetical protein